MTAQAAQTSQEVNSFEAYTLYSLERSVPALLRMMDQSKRIAVAWPAPMALAETAALCQEVAMLACYQNSLDDTLGAIEGEAGEQFNASCEQLKQVMDGMQDLLNMNDPDIAQRLFSTDLPDSLNRFADAIPLISRHIRDTYPLASPDDNGVNGKGDA